MEDFWSNDNKLWPILIMSYKLESSTVKNILILQWFNFWKDFIAMESLVNKQIDSVDLQITVKVLPGDRLWYHLDSICTCGFVCRRPYYISVCGTQKFIM